MKTFPPDFVEFKNPVPLFRKRGGGGGGSCYENGNYLQSDW